MDFAKLTDQPEITVTIGGREYHFSELPIGVAERRGDPPYGLAALQAWVNTTLPHPLDALRGHLDGLPIAVAAGLAETARQEARNWPPQIGTAAGAAVILGSHAGQAEAFYWGLRVHHPEMTRAEAAQIFRQLEKDTLKEVRQAKEAGVPFGDQGTARRIFAVLFGQDPDPEPDPLKGSGPSRSEMNSTGASSSRPANADSTCENGRSAAIPSLSS